MATTAAKAIRNQEARARLDGALGRLAKRLGVEEAPAAPPFPIRDPQLRAIWEWEQLADRVEAMDAALKDEGYSAAAGGAGKQEPSDSADAAAIPYEVRKAREEAAANAAEDAAQKPAKAAPRADKPKGRA